MSYQHEAALWHSGNSSWCGMHHSITVCLREGAPNIPKENLDTSGCALVTWHYSDSSSGYHITTKPGSKSLLVISLVQITPAAVVLHPVDRQPALTRITIHGPAPAHFMRPRLQQQNVPLALLRLLILSCCRICSNTVIS
jgi:hypothetical protein